MKYQCRQCEAMSAEISKVNVYSIGEKLFLLCKSANCGWSSRPFDSEEEIDKTYGKPQKVKVKHGSIDSSDD